MTESQPPIQPGLIAGNLADPVRLTDVRLSGVASNAARPGEMVGLWVRMSATSDEKLFHRAAKGIADHIALRAQAAGSPFETSSIGQLVCVIHQDDTAELWVDSAAVNHQVLVKRSIVPGHAVFESDIADLNGVDFPAINIEPTDRLIYLFREGWRFGLFFDFNPHGNFDRDAMVHDLGTLVRRMRYADLYDALADVQLFAKITAAGWFPFAEIIGTEFTAILDHAVSGFDLADLEPQFLAKFDAARVDHMLSRWLLKPHFAGKKVLLESAVKAFKNSDPVAVLKTALTEIEGILNEAYFRKFGKRTRKVSKLLDFAIAEAEERAGGPDTLLFTTAFGVYLREYVFQNFDPAIAPGRAGQRHAVGHGAAEADSYTMTRALQALLTLDQLSFYTAS